MCTQTIVNNSGVVYDRSMINLNVVNTQVLELDGRYF